jgi:hypothetical protein
MDGGAARTVRLFPVDRADAFPYNPVAARPFRIQAQVAQSVEQRTENPRVGGSIPPLGTIVFKGLAHSLDATIFACGSFAGGGVDNSPQDNQLRPPSVSIADLIRRFDKA